MFYQIFFSFLISDLNLNYNLRDNVTIRFASKVFVILFFNSRRISRMEVDLRKIINPLFNFKILYRMRFNQWSILVCSCWACLLMFSEKHEANAGLQEKNWGDCL